MCCAVLLCCAVMCVFVIIGLLAHLPCLQEKLRPELRDEEAALWMTQVLSDSATALMPQVMEKAHQWAQYWR